MSCCELIVYKTYDNPITLQISETISGVTTVFDFSPVTRMQLLFDGTDTDADSDDDSSLIDWSEGDGKVIFRLNDLALTGRYKATLIAHDSSHTDGQVLFHKGTSKLRFKFV
jgi:hypothetical protein